MEKRRESKFVLTTISESPEDAEPPSSVSILEQSSPHPLKKPQSRAFDVSDFNDDETIKISPKSLEFLHKFYPGASVKDWNNYKWQNKNAITNINQLMKMINLTDDEFKPSVDINNSLPLRITPYYATLLSVDNPDDPIRRTVVPRLDELIKSPGEASDPLSEEHCSPVPNLCSQIS